MTEVLFKVIVIGDPTVGKTSFVQRYVNDSFRRDYKGTIGGVYTYVYKYVNCILFLLIFVAPDLPFQANIFITIALILRGFLLIFGSPGEFR